MAGEFFYKEKPFRCGERESVLDCLIRNGEVVSYSCKTGVCQSCLMAASDGDLPEAAQKGLRAPQIQRKLLLACQCYPESVLHLTSPEDTGLNVTATVVDKQKIGNDVVLLRLETKDNFEAQPGQFVTLQTDSALARCYSLANATSISNQLEFQIRLIPNGKMSQWIADCAPGKSTLTVRGPAGDCFYSDSIPRDAPIVLAGTGTGLAPLWAIVHHAIRDGHAGSIKLFHGAVNAVDLYLNDELFQLADRNETVEYFPCSLNETTQPGVHVGDLQQLLLAQLPNELSECRLFLCGAPELVNSLRKKAFLAGVSSRNIFADPFVPTA
ncbi:MAG: 2Fe-2S iron-sulfur cluster binding domain-containing protein [Pirellulaceae bacterium]